MNILETVSVLSYPLSSRKKISIRYYSLFFNAFWLLCLLSIALFLVYYVFQINLETSGKYSLQENQALAKNLLEKNYSLGERAITANSSENLNSLVASLGFEKTGKIKYIKILDNQIVSK